MCILWLIGLFAIAAGVAPVAAALYALVHGVNAAAKAIKKKQNKE
jgi:hypothetical protein